MFEGWRPNNNAEAVLFGDSAYPLKSWLMTPNIPGYTGRGRGERRELTEAMQIYLARFRRTRILVERSIGILKNEYPVLKYCFRIRSSEKVAAIALACVALHNVQNLHVNGQYDGDMLNDDVLGKLMRILKASM